MGTDAELSAAVAASTRRSPTLLSQCSPKGVHPMPMIATRSRMPLLAMAPPSSPARRAGLPEIVVHSLGGEQPSERHLHAVADLDGSRVDVGQLALEAAAALEVDHRGDHRRRQGV